MSQWILGAGLLLAVGIALKKLLLRKTDSRPRLQLGNERFPTTSTEAAASVPPELTNASSELQNRLQTLAKQSSNDVRQAEIQKQPSVSASISPLNIPLPVMATGDHDDESGQRIDKDVSQNLDSGIAKQSTWQDRRLFTSFHGILNEEGGLTLPTPQPEELPIAEDDYLFGSVTPSLAQLLPESESRREVQRKNLTAAGYRSRASWLNLTALRFVLAFLSMVIIGALLIMAPPVAEPWLMGLLVGIPLLLWALPPLIVAVKAHERKIDIDRGLPDILDMLNMGVSQGLTVPQSMKRIAAEVGPVHPALAQELAIVTRQTELGSLMQAMKNFSNRIDTPDVNSFTSLLMQSESTGTSISHALTEYSDSIRNSLKERADASANAASFKLLFPVSLFLMPSVFLFLLGPAIVELSDFFGTRAEELNAERDSALGTLSQQPRLDLSRFSQNGSGGIQSGGR